MTCVPGVPKRYPELAVEIDATDDPALVMVAERMGGRGEGRQHYHHHHGERSLFHTPNPNPNPNPSRRLGIVF